MRWNLVLEHEHFQRCNCCSSVICPFSCRPLCDLQGEHSQAVELYERSLTIMEPQLGSDHSNVAQLLYNLGGVLSEQVQSPPITTTLSFLLSVSSLPLTH